MEACDTKTKVLQDLDEDEILAAFSAGHEVVFVEPWEPSVEAVQWFYDNKQEGGVIQIWAPDDALLKRAEEVNRTLNQEALRVWRLELAPMEERIRLLSVPYFVIPTDTEMDRAVANLARRTGIIR